MPTYTLREKTFEDAERIVYYVEGLDGDGDPFNGYENEPKNPVVDEQPLFVVTRDTTPKRLAAGAASGGFVVALLEAARILLS